MNTASETIERFLNTVEATAAQWDMWRRGDRLLVAVSGGPDSMALLDALARLSEEARLGLVVAHFHHGLRGPDADADADHVRRAAEAYGLRFVLGRGDARAEAQRMGRGLEAGARALRLRFLRQTAAEHDCRHIALGHTASDRAETVLIHLLRGTGLWGLRGIPPVRRPFVRPLIRLWRTDTEAYCRAAGISWRIDRSNLQPEAALRNKIRRQLLPLLEREYRRGAGRAIVRCAEAVDAELAWTEPLVQDIVGRAAQIEEGKVSLRLEELRSLPDGLLVRVLRAGAGEALGPLWDWGYVHFQALAHAVRRGQTGHTVVLPGGSEARVEYGTLIIGPRAAQPEADAIKPRPLPVPGRVAVPEAGVELEAAIVQRDEAPKPGPDTAVLDPALAHGLQVRGWQPGDRFHPLGAPGSKKLHDFFIDTKVPRRRRATVPLVIHPEKGIIWVVGLRISEGCRLRAGSQLALVIRAKPLGEARATVSLAEKQD